MKKLCLNCKKPFKTIYAIKKYCCSYCCSIYNGKHTSRPKRHINKKRCVECEKNYKLEPYNLKYDRYYCRCGYAELQLK